MYDEIKQSWPHTNKQLFEFVGFILNKAHQLIVLNKWKHCNG